MALNVSRNRETKTRVGKFRFKNIHPKFKPTDTHRPKGRSGHCMCSDESDLYIFGGYSPMDDRNGVPQSKVFPELWKFNFATQKWIEVMSDNTPDTCASASMAIHNKQVFVFGGTGYPFGQIMSNTFKSLKLSHKTNLGLTAAGEPRDEEMQRKHQWHLLETNPMSYNISGDVEDVTPPPAYGQSLVFHKDAIYVFGGAVGYYIEAVADLHRLNLHTMSWEKMSPSGKIPTGRYKQETITDGERFYVFGGGRLRHAEGLDKIYAYHITQNHWTEIITQADPVHGYPLARCSFGCAKEGDNVYVSGGRHYNVDVEHKSLTDIWHLRLTTMQWSKMDIRLPEALYFHSAIVSPAGDMYVFGGVHRDGYRAPYLYKVKLPFTLPKLAELAWDELTFRSRVQKVMTPWNMADLGVPWNFIDRIEQPKTSVDND